MQSYIGWLFLGQFIISIGFIALFTKAFKRGGVIEGIVFGILLAIILIGNLLIGYAVAPYPNNLIVKWTIDLLIQLPVAGIIVALIYRPKSKA